ncbi:MAG: peptide deformylase [Pirellulales bacterium]|nr:peptide deformylase [Pirellulales bacterium]
MWRSITKRSTGVNIIKYPHPTLRHPSKPLRRVDAELRRWIAEMFEVMYSRKGLGLAANQVDLPYRLFVINLKANEDEKDEELVFINPVITKHAGMAEAEEGCLSFPEIYAPVRRPEKVTITAYNLSGDEMRYELTGLLARAVQHEVDHLDGVVFIDRLGETARLSVRDALIGLERQFESDRARGLIPDDAQIAQRLADLERART